MKRIGSVIISLIAVLAIGFVSTNYLFPILKDFFGGRTYSQTNCLTEMITSEMDIYDIAKSYRDGKANVAVTLNVKNVIDGKYYAPLGSGVCVASKGYQTSIDDNLVASKGSYIATNYHNIEYFYSSDYTDCSVAIMTEDENSYPCEVLWSNKDLDLAVLYCDSVNINYVTMKDRSIFCEQEDKLDYEQIFTIGTPLDTDYINRLTIGNVASNNSMVYFTGETIYPKTNLIGTPTGYTNSPTASSTTGYEVLSNTYEDAIDVALGITNGNSGGGCFDEKGNLIGLTTLGGNVDRTHGNQMNGVVPIYPIAEILDKLIANNETNSNHSIYTIEKLNIVGLDANEASIVKSIYDEMVEEGYDFDYYFYDGRFYGLSYTRDFSFDEKGYYILSNSSVALSNLSRGKIITGAKINTNEKVDIIDRNDLIYLLLQVENGDSVTFYYDNTNITVTF